MKKVKITVMRKVRHDDLIEKYGAGVTLKEQSPEALAKAVYDFYKVPYHTIDFDVLTEK